MAKLIHAIFSYFVISSFSETALPLSKINNNLISPKMAGNRERSFIMIKPDGVHRGLVGEIIKRFEAKGFKLVAMKFMQVNYNFLEFFFSLKLNYLNMHSSIMTFML